MYTKVRIVEGCRVVYVLTDDTLWCLMVEETIAVTEIQSTRDVRNELLIVL